MKEDNLEIIAEIAQGYEGNPFLLELLVRGALSSNADSVKFQLVYADELATPNYQYYELFKSLEMDESVWVNVSRKIHSEGKKLYFDIFGDHSLSIAKKVNADGVKLSTTEFYNNDLLLKSLETFDRLYLSVGGIPVDDIDSIVKSHLFVHSEKLCLMYGFQSEPTPIENNNLNKIISFKARYPDFNVGFMDHSDGSSDDSLYLALVALGMNISCVEKHLTLDRSLAIEDYISGITPLDFSKFVELIRRYELALGTHSLDLTDLENEYRKKATKVVVALRDLGKNQIITSNDVSLKRTGSSSEGNFVRRLEDAVGKKLMCKIKKNSPIMESMI